jgi:small subunit ribosomal protein S1
MEQNDALNGQEEELENEQAEVASTTEQTEGAPSVSMEDLLEEEGLELDFPKQGEVRPGIIATISEGEVLVSVGTKSEGVLSGRELELIPEEERNAFEIGQEIPVYVITPEDPNGNVVLSYTRAQEEKDWEEVGRKLETEDIVESVVIGFNKGGLIVPIGNLRGFVPASQVSLLRRMSSTGDTPEARWGQMIDEEIQVRIIEVDRERRRLILSERLALQETRESLKDRLLDELQEGDIRTGRVTSLADFGAFVNIEGADGLVHLSEISWERIQHPTEVLQVGQEVEVKVISIDRDRKRIGLSIRQLQDDPWVKEVEHLQEGMLVEGTITHLTKFGAFAKISEDLEGLIHVSELSEQRIAHPKEVVHEDDVVTLRIIKIDLERHRIGLSLRKVDSPAYADMDWKMALAQEVGRAQEDEPVDEIRSILIEADESAEEILVENETAEMGVEAVEGADIESLTDDIPEEEVEEAAEDVVEDSVEVSVVKEEEEIAEEAAEDIAEELVEEAAEEVVEDTAEDSVEVSVVEEEEEITEETVEEAAEEVVEDTAEVSAEASVDEAVEETTEEEGLVEELIEDAVEEEAVEEAAEADDESIPEEPAAVSEAEIEEVETDESQALEDEIEDETDPETVVEDAENES